LKKKRQKNEYGNLLNLYNIMLWYVIIILIIICLFLFLKKIEGFNEYYLNGIDIIYWINLDRSLERRESMEQMFKDEVFFGIAIERNSAIDGNNLKNVEDKIKNYYAAEPALVYACLLSHLETIRKFNESNHNIALIMEDDCTLELKKYWKKNVREIIQNAPNDWEIIMLSYNAGEEHVLWNWDKMKSDYTDNHTSCAAAYIINKNASNKLINDIYLDNMYNLNKDLSPHADRYIFLSLKTYAYKFPMFIYKSNNESTLNHHVDDHNKTKLRIIEQYEKIK